MIVKSGNMSLGVNLLAALVERAAKALPDYDVEMLEMHHRMKVDAPSGTALLLGEAAAKGRGIALDKHCGASRATAIPGPREDGSIGFATLRGGRVVGEHEVILAGTGERITLSHSAEDRSIFARGALHGGALGPWQEAGPLRHDGCAGPLMAKLDDQAREDRRVLRAAEKAQSRSQDRTAIS